MKAVSNAMQYGSLQSQDILGARMNDRTPTERASILLVDDNEDVRASMRRVLAQEGYIVVEAASGDDAAALIEEDASLDMLVTDVRMPGPHDGVAVASYWGEKAPGRPVLFVSGDPSNQVAVGSLGLHQAVLQKPFRRVSLLHAVRCLLMRPHQTRSIPAICHELGDILASTLYHYAHADGSLKMPGRKSLDVEMQTGGEGSATAPAANTISSDVRRAHAIA